MNYGKIKIELERRKITIKDFCRKVDITEQGFHQMLRNESMRIDVLERMSQVLGVPISFWFNDNEINLGIQTKHIDVKEKEKISDFQIDTITTELNKLLKTLAKNR